MAKLEKNLLASIDANENLEHQRQLRQQRQDFLHKQEYLKHAYNVEVERQYWDIVRRGKE